MLKVYHLSIEGKRKGYFFCQKWYNNLGAELPRIRFCRVSPRDKQQFVLSYHLDFRTRLCDSSSMFSSQLYLKIFKSEVKDVKIDIGSDLIVGYSEVGY